MMTSYLMYIDPGSGSYLVQAIVAAVLGFLFYFKTIWWKIRSFFTKHRDDKSSPDPQETSDKQK